MGIPEGGWRVQVWHGPFDWIGTIDGWPKTIHASYVSDFVLDVHAALTIHPADEVQGKCAAASRDGRTTTTR